MTNLKFFQSKDLKLYKPVLEGLHYEFGFDYYHAILVWCNVIGYDGYDKDYFYEIFLIEYEGEIIGIVGLGEQYKNNKEELWLTWFGLIPKFRNRGFGKEALRFIEERATLLGCTHLFTYIDGSPLKFYERNGWTVISSVEEYISANPGLPEEAFSDKNHLVITKRL